VLQLAGVVEILLSHLESVIDLSTNVSGRIVRFGRGTLLGAAKVVFVDKGAGSRTADRGRDVFGSAKEGDGLVARFRAGEGCEGTEECFVMRVDGRGFIRCLDR